MAERNAERERVALERARAMAAAQRGDRGAYESLLRSLLPPLRAFVARRGVARSEIEDVVQEILLSIHRARHTWRAERPFDPWLWAVARNAVTDALRREGRERLRRVEPAGGIDDAALTHAGSDTERARDPESVLAALELSPELHAALERLPAAQREAVELLYIEQLPVAAAALRAGVTPNALKVRAHRGSRELLARLRAKERP